MLLATAKQLHLLSQRAKKNEWCWPQWNSIMSKHELQYATQDIPHSGISTNTMAPQLMRIGNVRQWWSEKKTLSPEGKGEYSTLVGIVGYFVDSHVRQRFRDEWNRCSSSANVSSNRRFTFGFRSWCILRGPVTLFPMRSHQGQDTNSYVDFEYWSILRCKRLIYVNLQLSHFLIDSRASQCQINIRKWQH